MDRIFSQYKVHMIAITVIVFMAILAVVVLLKSSSEEPIYPEYSAIEAPDMTSTIALVFDSENPNAYYDWAVVDTELGETFIETNSFSQYGNEYELLLATRKVTAEDATYTVPDYITLTLKVPNIATGLMDVMTYIDIGADGIADAAYLNDEEMNTQAALLIAQDQYSEELYTARDYMLDGISS